MANSEDTDIEKQKQIEKKKSSQRRVADTIPDIDMATMRTGTKEELPRCAGNAPIAIDVVAGTRYSWCTCGLSVKQPFCDGSHKGSEFRSHKFEAIEDETVYLCTCKKTANPPYCDGSHAGG